MEDLQYWKSKADKERQKRLVAQAKVYDFIFKDNNSEPFNYELKARIITLSEELQKVIKQRDELKKLLREKEVRKDNSASNQNFKVVIS